MCGVRLATKLVFVRFSTILKGSHWPRGKQYNDLATKTDFVFFQQSFDQLETGNDPKHDLLTNKTTTTTLKASVILERFLPSLQIFLNVTMMMMKMIFAVMDDLGLRV